MLDDWVVDVGAHCIERQGQRIRLEPLPVSVLAALCRRGGDIVGKQELLDACWPDDSCGDSPIHKVISGLRRALQDPSAKPRYIETIRKRGYRLVAPVHVLSATGPRSHRSALRGRSPFCGLAPFDMSDAGTFFGRDAAIAALHGHLDAQCRTGYPVVTLFGASGSGKTSVVQAGLVPALLAQSRPESGSPALRVSSVGWVDLGMVSGDDAWIMLAGALLDWEHDGTPVLSGYSMTTLADKLRLAPAEVLQSLALALHAIADASSRVRRPLLVIDGFEALFGRQIFASRFSETLRALAESKLFATLLVCRSDAYATMADHDIWAPAMRRGAQFHLPAPDGVSLAQMVRMPARAAGLAFGSDATGLVQLDDILCADALMASEALPLLEHTLQRLYDMRTAGDELSWDAYMRLGGMDGVISHYAESVFAALPQDSQDACLKLMLRSTCIAAEDAEPIGRWVNAEDLSDGGECHLADVLVDARLLLVDRCGPARSYRPAHLALLRTWPRMVATVAQHRAALIAREALQPWIRHWKDGGRSNAHLMPRGALLQKIASAMEASAVLFGMDELTFVRRSTSLSRWRSGKRRRS
ncbi:winged helix-turn-helix domain-containing protein [Mitsuaria sp. 7]|uniref:nSTAND1 domain-containing NTPase n=1 Tax=Mitsuaria sp. 7 TaxID=1658665 RepID=UPI0007DD2E79|nr:winged helix-turn-helix domain-containing protein [Mitsuaria sp. 7]ANH67128.1 hypothetical protein ABE85_05280 [Mitsuaria sp. 7]